MDQKAYRIGILGGSGLVGQHWAKSFPNAFVLLRAKTSRWPKAQVAPAESWPELMEQARCDIWLCAVGTTLKRAGSRQAFESVDYDLVVACAEAAKKSGTRSWGQVSAHGAHARSVFFYNRIKGKTEDALRDLKFESCLVARPSLLLGDRQESRVLEDWAKKIFSQIPWNFVPGTRNIRPIQASHVARHLAAKAVHSLGAPTGFLVLESGVMQT